MLQIAALLFVGLVAACIAYLQYGTARDKVNLDLFDRRMIVFDGVSFYLSTFVPEDLPTEKQELAYSEVAKFARFLFGEDVNIFLQSVTERSNRLRANARTIALNQPGERHQEAAAQSLVDMMELQSSFDRIYDVFGPYLKFDHIRSRGRRS